MGGNKAIAAAVLVVVILVAVIVLVRQQTGTAVVPDWVLDQEQTLILAEEPFTEETYVYRNIMNTPIDQDTGYRRIGGKLWASPMTCATSEMRGDPHRIPAPPRPIREPVEYDEEEEYLEEEDDLAEPYPCPICGREANPEVLDMMRMR